MGEALWVLEGAYLGLKNLYPDRFDDKGNIQQSCISSGAKVWGSACEQIITDYAAAIANPAACKGDACNDAIQCYVGNSATGSSQTTAELCDLVTLKYGYSQW